MEPNTHSKSSTIIKVIAGIIVLGLAAFGITKANNQGSTATSTPEMGALPADNSAQPVASTGRYKNGTYNAVGNYNSPAGKEEVEISLTLENDIITAATFKGKATNPGSVMNQDLFSKGFEAAVVGKSIDSLELTVVNGSSLTPKGFMDAVAKIKVEAKA